MRKSLGLPWKIQVRMLAVTSGAIGERKRRVGRKTAKDWSSAEVSAGPGVASAGAGSTWVMRASGLSPAFQNQSATEAACWAPASSRWSEWPAGRVSSSVAIMSSGIEAIWLRRPISCVLASGASFVEVSIRPRLRPNSRPSPSISTRNCSAEA